MKGLLLLVTTQVVWRWHLCMLLLLVGGCSSSELLKIPTQPESATIERYNTGKHRRSVQIFTPINLQHKIEALKLQQRTDNLFVLLDVSPAMGDTYHGRSRQEYGREILHRFNQSLPEIDLGGALYLFDSSRLPEERLPLSGRERQEDSFQGLYLPKLIEESFKMPHQQHYVGRESIASAVDALQRNIIAVNGSTALILITRWEQVDRSVVEAVARLRQRVGQASELCIYTIGVGNNLSRSLIEKVDNCGFSMAADKLAQPWEMSHFVERVLFYDSMDSDGDGIYDYRDHCPDTEKGRLVRFDGCYRFASAGSPLRSAHKIEVSRTQQIANGDQQWRSGETLAGYHSRLGLAHEVLFDSDSAHIKPNYALYLQQLAHLVVANRGSHVSIIGHTDYQGSAEYNDNLSRLRVEAVKKMLQQHGVATSRINTQTHGEYQPRSSNATIEGRLYNRRVELLLKGITIFGNENGRN